MNNDQDNTLGDEDIVDVLTDFAYIVDESKGVAVVTMLNGSLFLDAAAEIEQLRKESKELQATIERLNDLILTLRDDFIDIDDEYHDDLPRVRRKTPISAIVIRAENGEEYQLKKE